MSEYLDESRFMSGGRGILGVQGMAKSDQSDVADERLS
jgi:hypothetical protein